MMVSEEGAQAGGSGAGRDKKHTAARSPGPRSNGGAAATPKATTAADAAPSPSDSDDLVVVTLKASTGSIVSIEMAASDGSRHALTDSEGARLAGERPTFASLVHDAFEAGIACILDDRRGGADEALGETEEDADLHDALLDALIEHSAARRLLSRETLSSAVLGTIIDAASGGKAGAPPASA
jgi:hypothetical protein